MASPRAIFFRTETIEHPVCGVMGFGNETKRTECERYITDWPGGKRFSKTNARVWRIPGIVPVVDCDGAIWPRCKAVPFFWIFGLTIFCCPRLMESALIISEFQGGVENTVGESLTIEVRNSRDAIAPASAKAEDWLQSFQPSAKVQNLVLLA